MLIQQVMTMANAILSDSFGHSSEIKSLTERVTRLTNAVDYWNHRMLWGLVVAALAALWVVVATRLTIVRGKELTVAQGILEKAKEAELTLDLKEKDREIAVAGASSAQALMQAKSAEAHLADANARASEANARASALEVEALKLREQLVAQGPRENLLRGESRKKLVDALKPFAGQRIDVRRSASVIEVNGAVVMSTPIGDDTLGLSQALVGVLRDAGWNLPPSPLLSAFQGQGLKVEVVQKASPKTLGAAVALVEALRKVPLTVEGPLLDNDEQAKRVGTGVVLPAFDENTIILTVLTHP